MKIRLKQEKEKEGIVVEVLLDSGVIGLVTSSEFTRKNKFKMRRSRRPIYMRNIDSIFNYEGLIEHIVEVELFFKGYKKRMSIDVIRGQKLSVILGMPWLAYHNSEIDWRTGEVQMMRCLNECGNK